jgi:hypothetical protein
MLKNLCHLTRLLKMTQNYNNKKASNPTRDTLYTCKSTLSDKEP